MKKRLLAFFLNGLTAGVLGLGVGFAAAYIGYLTLPDEGRQKFAARVEVNLSHAGYPVRIDAEQERLAQLPLTEEENTHMALSILIGIAASLGVAHFVRRKS